MNDSLGLRSAQSPDLAAGSWRPNNDVEYCASPMELHASDELSIEDVGKRLTDGRRFDAARERLTRVGITGFDRGILALVRAETTGIELTQAQFDELLEGACRAVAADLLEAAVDQSEMSPDLEQRIARAAQGHALSYFGRTVNLETCVQVLVPWCYEAAKHSLVLYRRGEKPYGLTPKARIFPLGTTFESVDRWLISKSSTAAGRWDHEVRTEQSRRAWTGESNDKASTDPEDVRATAEPDLAAADVSTGSGMTEVDWLRRYIERSETNLSLQSPDVQLMQAGDRNRVIAIIVDAASKIAAALLHESWPSIARKANQRKNVYSELISRMIQEAGGDYCATSGLGLDATTKSRRLKRRERLEPNVLHLVIKAMNGVRREHDFAADGLGLVPRCLVAQQMWLLPPFLLNARKDASMPRMAARAEWLLDVVHEFRAYRHHSDYTSWIQPNLQWLRQSLASGLVPSADLGAESGRARSEGKDPVRVDALEAASRALATTETALASLQEDSR